MNLVVRLLTWHQKILANPSYLMLSRSFIHLLIHSTKILNEHGEQWLRKIQPLP